MAESAAATQDDHVKVVHKPLGPVATLLVWLYLAGLAVFFVYLLCEIWPPQPWPSNPDALADAERAVILRDAADKIAASDSAKAKAAAAAAADKDALAKDAAQKEDAAKAATQKAAAYTAPAQATPATRKEMEDVCSKPGGGKSSYPPLVCLFGKPFQPSLDVRLILLVICAGALGSFIHAGTSFVDYVGNRAFVRTWLWWYLLRPFIGAVLALLIYFVIRGGFVTGTALPSEAATAASFINPFGIAAMAGLSGLFAKQATDKLNEVFATLFRAAQGEGDAKRADKLQAGAQAAHIEAIQPKETTAGAANVLVTITGTNIAKDATVRFDKVELKPSSVNPPNSVTVALPATLTGKAAKFAVVVVNPSPAGGVASNEASFEVKPGAPP
jgi:hypothetical protein